MKHELNKKERKNWIQRENTQTNMEREWGRQWQMKPWNKIPYKNLNVKKRKRKNEVRILKLKMKDQLKKTKE